MSNQILLFVKKMLLFFSFALPLVPLWGQSWMILRESEEKRPFFIESSLSQARHYLEQLSWLGKMSFSFKEKKLSLRSTQYLLSLIAETINEGGSYAYLMENKTLSFHLIDSPSIFFFSLPSGDIYFSRSAFKNIFRNEGDLLSFLLYELTRIHFSIYPKRKIIPRGGLRPEEFLYLIQLPLEERKNINEFCYGVLKRSKRDPYLYLSWLQLLGRNYMKVPHFEDASGLAEQEFSYKKLYLQETSKNEKGQLKDASSKEYYDFTRNVLNERDNEKERYIMERKN